MSRHGLSDGNVCSGALFMRIGDLTLYDVCILEGIMKICIFIFSARGVTVSVGSASCVAAPDQWDELARFSYGFFHIFPPFFLHRPTP